MEVIEEPSHFYVFTKKVPYSQFWVIFPNEKGIYISIMVSVDEEWEATVVLTPIEGGFRLKKILDRGEKIEYEIDCKGIAFKDKEGLIYEFMP